MNAVFTVPGSSLSLPEEKMLSMDFPITWLSKWQGLVGRFITLKINNRCPLRCRHCSLFESGEPPEHEFLLSEAQLRSQIEAIDPAVYAVVVFVGGEPSLSVNSLRLGIDLCCERKLKSAIVSAPVWASSLSNANRFLDQVHGLNLLHLSFDLYHLEFLKASFYENALEAAAARGLPVAMLVCYANERELDDVNEKLRALRHRFIVSYSQVLPLGSGAQLLGQRQPGSTIETMADLLALPRSCRAGNTVMDKHGNVYGCCWAESVNSSPLAMSANGGGARTAIQELEASLIFQSVRKHGMINSRTEQQKQVMLEIAKGKYFVNECHLCLEAMAQGGSSVWR